jgi:hypothetical protein
MSSSFPSLNCKANRLEEMGGTDGFQACLAGTLTVNMCRVLAGMVPSMNLGENFQIIVFLYLFKRFLHFDNLTFITSLIGKTLYMSLCAQNHPTMLS